MCLGIPMRITKIEGEFAWVQSGGLSRRANIQMVSGVKPGDYVIIHAGFAIEIVNPEAARQTLKLVNLL